LVVLAINGYLIWRVYPYETPKYLAQNGQIS